MPSILFGGAFVMLVVQMTAADRACEPYRVSFFLAGDHTYFTVPSCRPIDSGSAPVVPALDKCGNCATDSGGNATASINWNTNGCTRHLCFNATKHTHKPIGPASGLEMHPKCAWGLLHLLNGTYRAPYRHASATAALDAMYPSEKYNPLNWARLMAAYKKGGQRALMNEAATMVNWAAHLSSACKGARSADEILAKKKTGAVCWNFVEDFHDLYCHYKSSMDMNDAAACATTFPIVEPLSVM